MDEMTFSRFARHDRFRPGLTALKQALEIRHQVPAKLFRILMAANAIGSKNRQNVLRKTRRICLWDFVSKQGSQRGKTNENCNRCGKSKDGNT